jgi:hypothetical protein
MPPPLIDPVAWIFTVMFQVIKGPGRALHAACRMLGGCRYCCALLATLLLHKHPVVLKSNPAESLFTMPKAWFSIAGVQLACHGIDITQHLSMLGLAYPCPHCCPLLVCVLQGTLCLTLHLAWHQPAGPTVRCTGPGGSTESSSSSGHPCPGHAGTAAGSSSRTAARVAEQ